VFFADAADHAITIKTIPESWLTSVTIALRSFSSARIGVLPEELNNGDRLCVGTSQPLVVTVTSRREISTEQQKELADWQADSLYGVVSSLDRKARRITLSLSSEAATKTYSIDVRQTRTSCVFAEPTRCATHVNGIGFSSGFPTIKRV